MRVTPALTQFRKIIRRHTRHYVHLARLIQLEDLTVGPDIRTIIGNKYRNITKQQHIVLFGIGLKLIPLFEKNKLFKLNGVNCRFKQVSRLIQSRFLTLSETFWPLIPTLMGKEVA